MHTFRCKRSRRTLCHVSIVILVFPSLIVCNIHSTAISHTEDGSIPAALAYHFKVLTTFDYEISLVSD